MDNKIKTYEEFEIRLKSQAVPQIEHRDSLKNKLIERKKTYKPLCLRASFIAILLSIFLTASIATAMQYTGWKLFNSEGEEIFVVKTMEDDEKKRVEYQSKNINIQDKLNKAVPDGKFQYFLSVDEYEELGATILTWRSNGEKILTREKIPDFYKGSLVFPESLINNYTFTEGTVYYEIADHDPEVVAEEMYKEAKENNLKYITKEGEFSNNVDYVTLMYKENENDFGGIQIILQPSAGMMTTKILEGYTMITEEGVDFIVNKKEQTILFVKEADSKTMLVQIIANLTDENFDEKKELLPIAKSIIK
ncbi:hypothetical protein PB01_14165 [Psychrobacillus glaciei]|uniref:DUF4367 domain-containing protein n=1 Tax=Psychrobacillus glaciei TaxID=2283160 RepID=A0A5J6SPE8_9BACI|nr:hypothetical protein [Psychrobacillus glaciei]QFF99876.1 hypothetical protein PB01_14165 [Psychrobacillus glaciei]